MTSRRQAIGAGFSALATLAVGASPASAGWRGDAAAPDDEAYWASVAARCYVTAREPVTLEHGNFGTLAWPVMQVYKRWIEQVNEQGAYYARRQFPADAQRIREKVARSLGVDVDEIAFTRGATESLQALIGGYAGLRPGDQVLYCDLDYDSMQAAMRWLQARRGVQSIAVQVPEPATHQGLIDFYERALRDHPRVRLMLLTQVSHRTGLVMPVGEIVAMAAQRGVDVIVDAAHAWGQVPMDLRGSGVAFAGLTCHKWLGAPLGVGLIYVRRDRLVDIEPYMGSEDYPAVVDVRDRVHTGTTNIAALLAVEAALDLHGALGPQAKARRLSWLRQRWMQPLRDTPRLQLLVPEDPRLAGGMASFRLAGATSVADNQRLARRLLEEFGVFTVHRTGVAAGACVRVTPNVFTPAADVDRLLIALQALAA